MVDDERDVLDEKLLWGGEDDDDEDYPDDDPFDDWHPDELEEHVRVERFSKLIKKMDENSDSFVDRKELVHWTLRALQNMDTRELKEDFDIANGDGDAGVTWSEYVENIYGIKPEQHDSFSLNDLEENAEMQDYNRNFNREKAKFEAADGNGDGKLDLEEYEVFYNPGKNVEATENAIKAALKSVDTDGDGKISETEFMNDFKDPSFKGDDEFQSQEEEVFKDMDMDGNNFLDGDELVLWIQQDNGEIAVDETLHLIETADENDDGKLSEDEVMQAMEDFIESDATEYGYMLKHDEL